MQPICTECFVQIQRVDPRSSVPPSSKPATCPFCVEPDFGVVYDPSSLGMEQSDPKAAIEHAAAAIGTGGARANKERRSFPPDHPRVVLVGTSFRHRFTHTDYIHPNWREKLDRALATTERQENRRVIMRQEGDSLVPIGVSSSRTGNALASIISHNSQFGYNGPGGSIILHGNVLENEILQHSPRGRRPSHPPRPSEESRTLTGLSIEDLDDIILREALRISRIEHQQQSQPQESPETPGRRRHSFFGKLAHSPGRLGMRAGFTSREAHHGPPSPSLIRTSSAHSMSPTRSSASQRSSISTHPPSPSRRSRLSTASGPDPLRPTHSTSSNAPSVSSGHSGGADSTSPTPSTTERSSAGTSSNTPSSVFINTDRAPRSYASSSSPGVASHHAMAETHDTPTLPSTSAFLHPPAVSSPLAPSFCNSPAQLQSTSSHTSAPRPPVTSSPAFRDLEGLVLGSSSMPAVRHSIDLHSLSSETQKRSTNPFRARAASLHKPSPP